MNNTKANLTAIAAILIAATLVVGTGTFVTKTAFAANNSGNTVTAEINSQSATQSGFDNKQEQQASKLICTHPNNNATCEQEGATSSTTIPQQSTTAILTVKKDVVGEGKSPSDFQIQVTGNNPKPATFLGSSTGTDVTLEPGPFKVSETPLFDNSVSNYQPDFLKDCSNGGNGIIQANEHKTCIITNIPIGPPEK